VIETVGVGQVEVEIAGHAGFHGGGGEPTVGRCGTGREGRIARDRRSLRVNKADRPGTDETARDLDGNARLAGELEWRPRC